MADPELGFHSALLLDILSLRQLLAQLQSRPRDLMS